MGVGCYEECKRFMSNEKKNEFIDDAITDIPIKQKKRVSFVEKNSKNFQKRRTFTESIFALFESSNKKKKSNLKSPSTKNVINHMKNNKDINVRSSKNKKHASLRLNKITNKIEINNFNIQSNYIIQNKELEENKNLKEINLEIKQSQIEESKDEESIKNFIEEDKENKENKEKELIVNKENNFDFNNNIKENPEIKSEDETQEVNKNIEKEISKSDVLENQKNEDNSSLTNDNNIENNNDDNINTEQKSDNKGIKGEEKESNNNNEDDNNFDIENNN